MVEVIAAPTRKLTVTNYLDPTAVRADITYSLADLTNAMQEQAGFRLHYGEIAAKCAKQVDDLKTTIEIAEAKVYRHVRDKFVDDGVKVTEALLDKEIIVNETIIALKRALNEAKQIEATAKAAFAAFGDRKDMLVQLGAKDRAELEGELRLLGSAEREDKIENLKSRFLERKKAS